MVLPIVHTLNMHVKCPGNIFTWPQRGKAKTKRDLACPGNYKSQITNYKKWIKNGVVSLHWTKNSSVPLFVKGQTMGSGQVICGQAPTKKEYRIM
jgi:hypothetical protein